MLGNPCFWPQNPQTQGFLTQKKGFLTQKQGFWLNNRKLFPNYFRKIFASSKRPDISEKFLNFDNQNIPKLAKTKSLENSIFRRALLFIPIYSLHM